MVQASARLERLDTVRPLVRYVDGDQAVVEIQIAVRRPLGLTDNVAAAASRELVVRVIGADGFEDEQRYAQGLRQPPRSLYFTLVQPQRWWPAGMGDQPLYQLSVDLLIDGNLADTWEGPIGLTSVRLTDPATPVLLLVNGRERTVRSLITLDGTDESRMLPVAGDSLVLVRDHYAPDVLYHAADRAGVLVVQSVPLDPLGRPETKLVSQVNRLAGHPSLAGWYVGHLGAQSDRVAQSIQELDPTHLVLRGLGALAKRRVAS